MVRTWRNLADRLRRLRLAEGGAAAVEFALILPIMLLLYIGSVEASTLISMDRRVQSVAGAVGDLVARSNATLAAADLTDYFRAAGGIMTPYPSSELKQVVTLVNVDATGKATIGWCKQYVNGIYATCSDYPTGYKLPAAMIAVAKGQSVIVATASYSYLPLYGIVIKQAVQLNRENYFMPRFGGTIAVN